MPISMWLSAPPKTSFPPLIIAGLSGGRWCN